MDELTRRQTLAAAAAFAAVPAGAAAQVVRYADDPRQAVRLWNGRPPGAPAVLPSLVLPERATPPAPRDRYAAGIADPVMEVFRPARPNGAAVLILPGGGYVRVVVDKEGYELARLLNEAGVTAFVLRYRLPAEGWLQRADAPLQDAQRALRLLRNFARRYELDAGRIGVMGFSAGGHLAASLATRYGRIVYPARDPADRVSARPDFAALLYPVILMDGPSVHAGSRTALLGPSPSPEQMSAYSPDRTVSGTTPPTFLVHAADDASVPLDNSLAMLAALRRAKVPAELHVFEEGGHGFGLRGAVGLPARAWPDLLLAWLRRRRIIPA